MEAKLSHLTMIQDVIKRMAGNSFLLKGWSVTLVSALFALAAANSDKRFLLVAFLPVILFWTLDAYFLRQERLFRRLYDHVRSLETQSIDFSMDTSPYQPSVPKYIATMFSRRLLVFYVAMLAPIVALLLIATS